MISSSQEYKLFALHVRRVQADSDTGDTCLSSFRYLHAETLAASSSSSLVVLFVSLQPLYARGELGGDFLKSQKYENFHSSAGVSIESW